MGAKIKILNTICHNIGEQNHFEDLHKLITIRNVFAHGKPFEDENMIFKLAELKSDGKIKKSELDKLAEDFLRLFNEQNQKLIQFHGKIKNQYKKNQ